MSLKQPKHCVGREGGGSLSCGFNGGCAFSLCWMVASNYKDCFYVPWKLLGGGALGRNKVTWEGKGDPGIHSYPPSRANTSRIPE